MKLLGIDLVQVLKQQVKSELKIVDKEFPLDTKREIGDIVKVRCYTLSFF
jgi:hypothetical protein